MAEPFFTINHTTLAVYIRLVNMSPRCRSEYASRVCSLACICLLLVLVVVSATAVTTSSSNSTSNQTSLSSSTHGLIPDQMLAAGAIRGLKACGIRTRKCLKISQHSTGPNSMYNVQMINICQDCYLCRARAFCPGFITTMAVNPDVFIRVSKDSCRIKGGHTVYPNEMLLFTYGASFPSVIQPAARAAKHCGAGRRSHWPGHGK